MIFPNFLRSQVLSCWATCKATLIYEFITNNQASFHLWWNENLLNHEKVLQYYEHDCLKGFLLLFMSLLRALIVRNSHILPGIYFILYKNNLDQTWNAFNAKFEPQRKDGESSYQVRQILALFCRLIALTLV